MIPRTEDLFHENNVLVDFRYGVDTCEATWSGGYVSFFKKPSEEVDFYIGIHFSEFYDTAQKRKIPTKTKCILPGNTPNDQITMSEIIFNPTESITEIDFHDSDGYVFLSDSIWDRKWLKQGPNKRRIEFDKTTFREIMKWNTKNFTITEPYIPEEYWEQNHPGQDEKAAEDIFPVSIAGLKYKRNIKGTEVDVYDVLKAFDVTCPARAHALKKLLCSGLRNKGSVLQDLTEAAEAVQRAIQLQKETENEARSKS